MDTPATAQDIYGSGWLIERLATIVQTHGAVGGDFPGATAGLLSDLRTLQVALPTAIAAITTTESTRDAATQRGASGEA